MLPVHSYVEPEEFSHHIVLVDLLVVLARLVQKLELVILQLYPALQLFVLCKLPRLQTKE